MLSFFILAGVSWFLMANRTQVVLVSNSPQAAHAQCQSQMVDSLLAADWSHKGDEMVFIDEGVEHVEMLLPKLAAYEVVMIKRNADGVQQISNALSARDGLSGLHIVSHGGSGSLLLGDGYLSLATLSDYADSLALWGQSLSQEADILLYGCNVAAGQSGQAFIEQLSTLTGADIAASNDLTGSAKQGGDWELEVAQGHLDTQALAFSSSYPGVLDYVIEQNSADFAPTQLETFGQSFTTNQAGEITAIEIHVSNAVNDCTLSIYDGENVNESAKHTQSVNLVANVNQISLLSPVAVNENSMYTFVFSNCSTGAEHNSNVYVQGRKFESASFKDDLDLKFKVSIQDPAPAPPPPPAPTAIPNQPPQVSTPLPDITVVEGAADQTINPLNYFSDVEGDLFFLSVTGNSNPAVVPNLPEGHFLGNIDRMAIQFGEVGQTEITLQAKEMRSNATVEDTFSVTVLERPTISMSKSVSDASVQAGQRITYTMAITNSGPSTATYALLSDDLPAALSLVNGSISASGITTGRVGSTLPDLVSHMTLVPEQSVNLSFATTVNDDVLANQLITNTAQLTATEVMTPLIASRVIQVISPTLAISDSHANEAAGTIDFALTLSRASAIPITLDFTTVSASATITDYTPISGTLTIDAQAISGTLSVAINDDQLVEADETFTIQLSNASHATIADGEAVGTISDNDEAPTDEDTDGVNNEIESQVPNLLGSGSGDGNGDGIADRAQQHVTSLPNSTNGDYVTFAAANNQSLTDVQAQSVPAETPAEADFRQGVFSWQASGLSAGDAISITLILHSSDSATLPNSYWKYGPTPDNPTAHWYNFNFDGTTGAQIDGNRITLHFVDGARGDSDLEANGQIADPGGPAIYTAPTALTLSDIGSPEPAKGYAGALLALLMVAGLFVALRRKEE